MLSRRIFRLFLSSTFSDFVAEREALRTRVFPQLEKLCRDHGAVFQAVDLTQLLQLGKDLQEIRRCQQLSPRPNFAVLLGNRYGWEPPPARIPIDHWRLLLAAASPAERKIIRAGYRGPDRNAIPPVYHIHDRQGGWELSESRERILRDALRSCVAKADFPESEKVAYFASATHQEIILGALLDHDENGEVLHPERPAAAGAFVRRATRPARIGPAHAGRTRPPCRSSAGWPPPARAEGCPDAGLQGSAPMRTVNHRVCHTRPRRATSAPETPPADPMGPAGVRASRRRRRPTIQRSGGQTPKAFFTASIAFSSSHGKSLTVTVFSWPAFLNVLVTVLQSRPMWP